MTAVPNSFGESFGLLKSTQPSSLQPIPSVVILFVSIYSVFLFNLVLLFLPLVLIL